MADNGNDGIASEQSAAERKRFRVLAGTGGRDLREKIENPVVFQPPGAAAANPVTSRANQNQPAPVFGQKSNSRTLTWRVR